MKKLLTILICVLLGFGTTYAAKAHAKAELTLYAWPSIVAGYVEVSKTSISNFANYTSWSTTQDYDMNEQNQIMNKFLIEKTGISPQKCEEGGFIYTFESFEHIDEVLDVFSKLPESKAPIDYIICVQVLGADFRQEVLQLKELISLKMLNKITTLSDTAYRYSFNKNQKYSLSQLGVFQKPNGTFEVHQFVRKNILIK